MILDKLIEAARDNVMTTDEKEAQRRSFAFGNTSIENERITRATIDEAAEAGRVSLYDDLQEGRLELLRNLLDELSSGQSVVVCALVRDMVDAAYEEGRREHVAP